METATGSGATGTTDGRGRAGRRGLVAAAAAFAAGLLARPADKAAAGMDGDVILGDNLNVVARTRIVTAAGFAPANAFEVDASAGNASSNATTAIRGTGSGTSAGVSGYAGTGSAASGVFGSTTAGFGSGVLGNSSGANGSGVGGVALGATSNGVSGQASSTNSNGVRGYFYGGTGGNGVLGQAEGGNIGVQGQSQFGIGVYGTSAGAYGVVGQTAINGTFGLYGSGLQNGAVGVGGAGYNGALAAQFSGPVRVYGQIILEQQQGLPAGSAAFVVGPGVTKNAAVLHPDGTHRLFHCVEAPEPWFEDFGEGTITAGRAEVRLDPGFAGAVDMGKLHVFLTAHDGDHALHVAGRNATGFSVGVNPSASASARGRRGSDLSGTFTYRVVAKRRDVSGERLAKVTLPQEIKQPAPLPKLEPFPTAPTSGDGKPDRKP